MASPAATGTVTPPATLPANFFDQQGQHPPPPPPPPKPPQSLASRLLFGENNQDLEEAKGMVKGAGRTVAGLLDLYSKLPNNMGGGDAAASAADAIRNRTQLHGEYQELGNVDETVAELLGPGVLERAGLGVATEGAEALKNAPKISEQLTGLAKRAKVLEDFPDLHALVRRGIESVKASPAGQTAQRVLATAPGRIAAETGKGIVTGAARGAAEQGGQTFVKTGGDIDQTEQSAETGALLGGAGGGIFRGGAEALRQGADKIESLRPLARTLAGATYEQDPKTGKLLLRNRADVRTDPATQAADESLGHIGKTAVANSAIRTNAERAPTEATALPESRRLPAPRAGGDPDTTSSLSTNTPLFNIPMTPQTEEITYPPPEGEYRTDIRTVRNPDYDPLRGGNVVPGKAQLGSTGETVPERSFGGPRSASQVRLDAAKGAVPERMVTGEPTTTERYGYYTPPPPGSGGTITTSGGGAMILTNDGAGMSVPRARQQLSQVNRILDDDDQVSEMGVRKAAALTAQRDDLQEQLRRYDDYAASQPHFPTLNPVDAARYTDNLQEAAEQLKGHNGALWTKADAASGNQFTALRNEEKFIRAKLNAKTPAPGEKYTDLLQQLKQNQQDQLDFFDKYRTTVSPEEAKSKISGYQDGIVLQNLHDLMQREFNGITQPEEARSIAKGGKLQRVFQPGGLTQKLEDFYNDGFRDSDTNRQVLQRTIGQDHMDNLKELSEMFQGAERRAQSQGLMKTIASTIHHHALGLRGILGGTGGVGLLAAHEFGKAAGVAALPIYTGTYAGIRDYVADQAISNPDFAKKFVYSIKNNIPARTAGPILTERLLTRTAAGALNAQSTEEQQRRVMRDKQVVAPDAARGVQAVSLPTVQPE